MRTEQEIKSAIEGILKGEGYLLAITGNDRIDEHEIVVSALKWVLE